MPLKCDNTVKRNSRHTLLDGAKNVLLKWDYWNDQKSTNHVLQLLKLNRYQGTNK